MDSQGLRSKDFLLVFMGQRFRKLEIRNTKFETSTNDQNSNDPNRKNLDFGYSNYLRNNLLSPGGRGLR
jgi:hypothetical protein